MHVWLCSNFFTREKKSEQKGVVKLFWEMSHFTLLFLKYTLIYKEPMPSTIKESFSRSVKDFTKCVRYGGASYSSKTLLCK